LLVLIAAAEAEAAFGEIFADGDFFLKAAAADAGEDAGPDAGTVAARNDVFIDGGMGLAGFGGANFGNGFDPDGGRVAGNAVAGDTFANFERFELEFVEVNDFAALAEAAFHQEAGEGFIAFAGRREVDIPELGARVEKVDSVKVTVGFLVDFGDDAGASALPLIGFELAAEVEFLAG
jgi:hypothetical protein